MKKDAYYFSHDANAQDDPKMMVLIEQMGMEGVGIFWCLIEKLRSEKDYKLPLIVIGPFAKRWNTSKEKVETVVKNYNLFVVENQYFFSLRLQNSMNEKSEKARLSASYRWNNATDMQPHNERNANGMRNDAIKGKERKEKERKGVASGLPPILSEVIMFFTGNGFSEQLAVKAFNFYEDANWRDSKGNQVKNWKKKMQSVWFKPEEKNGQPEYGSKEWKLNKNNWI